MNKQLKIITVLIGLLSLPVFYNNCGQSIISGNKIGASGDSGNSDPSTLNQAPKLTCDIQKADGSKTYLTVSTIEANDIKFEDPTDADNIKINCLKTADESPASELTFFIDLDYDASAPDFKPLEAVYAPFEATLRRMVAIKACDPSGACSNPKIFNLEVDCAVAVAPKINAATISVASGAKKNFFNYSVAGVVDTRPLEYAWDFNGDGDFDPFKLGDFNIWTDSANLSDIYNIYGTNRNVTVRVRNSCGKEVDLKKNVTIDVSNIPKDQPAQVMAYWYIQGDIAGAHPSNPQRTNGDLLVTQYPEDKKFNRMDCAYQKPVAVGGKGSFLVSGFNHYPARDKDHNNYVLQDAPYMHGLTLNISGIPDNGMDGVQTFKMSDGIFVSKARYSVSIVDESPNLDLKNENFDKNGECQVTFTMERATSVKPCASGPAAEQTAYNLYGEYSCPNLKSTSSARSVSVSNAKYFCQYAIGTACIGGGQGQGGSPPMPE